MNDNERPAEFDRAVLLYKGALLKHIKQRVPLGKRADAMQDVLTYIFSHWRGFRCDNNLSNPYARGGGFRSWMYWQMHGVLSNYDRKKEVKFVYADSHKKYEHLLTVPAQQEASLMARDLLERVKGRNGAILLLGAAGFEQDEIAKEFGISHQRVSQIQQQARKQLLKVAA